MSAKAKNISRALGIAFLLQFITSFSSGSFIRPLWLVEGDIGKTMLKIADNPNLFQINILLDMLTAFGVIFLGVVLYSALKKYGKKTALVALGFYILEGGVLAASKSAAISLLGFSQEYASTGQPESLLVFGKVALESMDFLGDTLHVLAFCFGAILFYYLLNKSDLMPSWASLWGLVTVLPILVGTLTAVFNYHLPFVLFIPYVPFEPVMGIWFLIKGVPEVETA